MKPFAYGNPWLPEVNSIRIARVPRLCGMTNNSDVNGNEPIFCQSLSTQDRCLLPTATSAAFQGRRTSPAEVVYAYAHPDEETGAKNQRHDGLARCRGSLRLGHQSARWQCTSDRSSLRRDWSMDPGHAPLSHGSRTRSPSKTKDAQN